MRKLALLLAAFALVAAACGDDDATTDTSDTTVEDGATTDDDMDNADMEDDGSHSDDDGEDMAAGDEPEGDPLVFIGTLSGDVEVPGPGDDGAEGRVEIESDIDGDLCFDMVVEGLDSDVGAAHIHEAPAGESGDVVVDIGANTSSEGDVDIWDDVCITVDADLVQRIAATPDQFYVNVHTATFGAGAVRAQLTTGSIFDLELSN